MKISFLSIKNYRSKYMFFIVMLLTGCTPLFTHAQQQPIRTTTYFHHDASGSVVAATNEAGEEIWRKNYKPYGEQQAGSDQTESISYTGHTHDKNLGLTYMKARYYDPQAGRFMGLDPVGVLESVEANPQMFNRYAYANNNPYAFTDPDGGAPKGRGDGGSSAAAGALVGCMIGNCNPRLSRAMSATAAKGGNYAAAGSIALNGGMNSKDFVKMVDKTQKKKGAKKASDITTPYQRPSGATTKAQRESVQGKPCVDCGVTTSKQYADHKNPLVKEYYKDGKIDKRRMRDIDSVQPQCPTCSNKQGAKLSQFSKQQKKDRGL